jgi:subtilisin family serine protease
LAVTGRSAVLAIAVVALVPSGVAGQTVGPPNPLIRNCVPADWQRSDVRWSRDIAPRNKIDDLIDSSTDARVDIIVNFNRCIRPSDLDTLAQLSPEGRVVLKGRFIPFVSMAEVERGHVAAIAALPQVAFVERKLGFSGSLDISVANIRVASAPGLTDTVQDRFPGINGAGINIAIVDSGADDFGGPGTTHRTLPSAVAFYDAVTADNPVPPRDPNSNPDDDLYHGTHVASIALGRGLGATSGTFPRGVAPRAGLIDVRVVNAATDPLCTTGSWDDVVRGLEQVYLSRTAWNVGVVNLSIGQCDASGQVASDGLDAFSQLVDVAESMGIVVVAAAGNDGPSNQGIPAPAAATRAITVAASDDQNSTDRSQSTIADLSNRGPRDDDSDGVSLDELKPDLTAPGIGISAAELTRRRAGSKSVALQWRRLTWRDWLLSSSRSGPECTLPRSNSSSSRRQSGEALPRLRAPLSVGIESGASASSTASLPSICSARRASEPT